MIPFEVGEVLRLFEDLGRWRAGEFFVFLGVNKELGYPILLAPDGRQAAVPTGYLQRWREDGGWGATAG